MTYPDDRMVSYTYDSMNRPVLQVNALGGVTEIEYGLLGRITHVTAVHYGVSDAPSVGEVLVACLLVFAAAVSPIPGDEVAACGALVSLFAH